jgi:hypothetical protein
MTAPRAHEQYHQCNVWATPPCSTGQYGSVELSLEHLSEERILSVTVHSCRGLRRIDRQGLSDPYVKVFLAPSPKKVCSTQDYLIKLWLGARFDLIGTCTQCIATVLHEYTTCMHADINYNIKSE